MGRKSGQKEPNSAHKRGNYTNSNDGLACVLSRQYPELMIPRDNMTTRFHFDKKFEKRWINKANWKSAAGTYGLPATDYLVAEGEDAGVTVDELAKKGVGILLHGPEPFCEIGNGFMAMTLRNEEERLRELYWAGLSGMELSKVIIGG